MDALGLMGTLGTLAGSGLSVLGSTAANVNHGSNDVDISPPNGATIALLTWYALNGPYTHPMAGLCAKGGSIGLIKDLREFYGQVSWTGGKVVIERDPNSDYVLNIVFFG